MSSPCEMFRPSKITGFTSHRPSIHRELQSWKKVFLSLQKGSSGKHILLRRLGRFPCLYYSCSMAPFPSHCHPKSQALASFVRSNSHERSNSRTCHQRSNSGNPYWYSSSQLKDNLVFRFGDTVRQWPITTVADRNSLSYH